MKYLHKSNELQKQQQNYKKVYAIKHYPALLLNL